MKLKHAAIAYNFNSKDIKIQSLKDGTPRGWADGYRLTIGAVFSDVRDLEGWKASHRAMSDFIGVTVRDGVDPAAAYKVFWQIDEFRNGIPVDMPAPGNAGRT